MCSSDLGGQRRIPAQWNSGGINCADREKDEGGNTENRRDDRDEVGVDLEAAEKAADKMALQHPGDDEPRGKKTDERD